MQHPSNGTLRPETYRLPGFGIGESMVTITLDADTAQKLRDALSDAPARRMVGRWSCLGESRGSPVPSLQPVEWRVYPESENLLHTIDKYGPQRTAETDAGRYLAQRGVLIRNGEYYERAPRD